MQKRKYGMRAACKTCGQDIEWLGIYGWRDRGGNRSCCPYIVKGEVIRPPIKAKHQAAA